MKPIELREKDIERYLVNEVRKIGGTAYKFTSPGRRSVPDRMILLKGQPAIFVECKRPGGKLTQGQKREIEKLREKDFQVYVVDSKQKVNNFVWMIS